jgi:hypothetical protein
MRVHPNQVNPNAQLDSMYAAQKAAAKREAVRTRKKLNEFASALAGEADLDGAFTVTATENPETKRILNGAARPNQTLRGRFRTGLRREHGVIPKARIFTSGPRDLARNAQSGALPARTAPLIRAPAYFTVAEILTLSVIDPEVPITLMLVVPELGPAPLVNVKTVDPFPGAATAVGLKLAEMPVGNWEAENATAPLKPPLAALVIFRLPLAVELTVTAVVLGVNDTPGTLTVIVCFWVTPPPVADTVIE